MDESRPESSAQNNRTRLASLCSAFVLPVLLLLPFGGKAFHVDDPMYVWVAQHIVDDPLDFYGFDVNWFGRDQPVYETNHNPPGLPYTLAIVGLAVGWGEWPLHLVTIVFASFLGGGTWLLADKLCRSPLVAALIAIASPVVLVSANSVMTDVPMLACYVWAIYLWVLGSPSHRHRFYLLSAVLLSLSMVYKYFGITAVPLLLAYSLVKHRRPGWWIGYLMIPVAALVAYQAWSHTLYGSGMFSSAASFAREFSTNAVIAFMRPRILIGLSFAGGTLIAAVFFAYRLWSWRMLGAWGVLLSAAVVAVHSFSPTLLYRVEPEYELTWLLSAHYAVFVVVAVQVAVIAASDLWRSRSAESLLLVLWIGGTFVFATYLNWSITARTVLPLAPPTAILIVRRLERRADGVPLPISARQLWPLAPALALSIWVVYGDYAYANAFRRAANEFARVDADYPARYWFEGHYGFQYYMLQNGMEYFTDDREPEIRLNDRVAFPTWSSVQPRYDPRRARTFPQLGLTYPNTSCVATWHPLRGAGFYTSISGPLPYAFGPAPPVEFFVYHIGLYDQQ